MRCNGCLPRNELAQRVGYPVADDEDDERYLGTVRVFLLCPVRVERPTLHNLSWNGCWALEARADRSLI